MGNVLVLCYHALSDTWPADLSTTPERFEEQLRLLLGRGYRPVTFEEAVRSHDGKVFSVTFDDAYRSVLERAFPIMERLEVPGAVFVPTDFPDAAGPMGWPGIDRWLRGPHEEELRAMSWDDLRALGAAGWEIGSHTCSHPRLTTLPDARLATELRESRTAVERELGRPCASIAYPYGDVDDRVVAAAGAAGYSFGASLPKRLASRGPLDHPRVGVYHGDDLRRFKLKVSPLARAIRRHLSW